MNEEERAYYENAFEGFTCTGETLEETYEEEEGRDAGGCTYVVYKANGRKWTPYGMCRDCGDHYIIAKWSSYVRIDKGTLKKTVDVEDM